MIDHASLPVSDLAASAEFYRCVLAPLGHAKLIERPATVGFGKRYPELWLNRRPGLITASHETGHHLALRARDIAAVDACHAAAIIAGGRCDGPPGPRQGAINRYYGAFFRDRDGNKIEVLTFPETKSP